MLWGGNKGYGNGFDAQKREGGGACSMSVPEYAVIKYAIIKCLHNKVLKYKI